MTASMLLLVVSSLSAGSGCVGACDGYSCGPGGVYVSWLPGELPAGDTQVCVNGKCSTVTPSEAGRSVGAGEPMTVLEANVEVIPPDTKDVEVSLVVSQGQVEVARLSGTGSQSRGACCGSSASFEVEGSSLVQR